MTNIQTYYGGSILAVKSKDSIVLLSDKRLGQGNLTINKNFTKIHKITNKLFVGLSEFIPDCQFLLKKIKKNHNLFVLSENRPMEPEELANMISFILYQRRFSPLFINPIVVGIKKNNDTYIAGMDLIGCMEEPHNFVSGGTAEKNLSGLCEALWNEDLKGEDLFVMAVQAFVNAVDRDALSGWGMEGYLIQKDKIIKRSVKTRQD